MSKPTYTIAVDAMGGDFGPRVAIPASLFFAARHSDVTLLIVGLQDQLQKYLPPTLPPNVQLIPAANVVLPTDKPSSVLRSKRDSSMWIAIDQVAQTHADACVSAGNTGALMVIGRHLLKTLQGISRPAICKPMPTRKGPAYVLDLGANVDCDAEQLLQFALMGNEAVKALELIDKPRVALLNIGEEEIKGNEQVRQAAILCDSHESLNFTGYIEADTLFSGDVDVVVCDGFVGNAVLKAASGAARFLTDELRSRLKENRIAGLLSLLMRPVLRKWHTKFDPGRYNGACFLGLRGTLIKSHGSADADAFQCALEIALEHVKRQVPLRIGERMSVLVSASSSSQPVS